MTANLAMQVIHQIYGLSDFGRKKGTLLQRKVFYEKVSHSYWRSLVPTQINHNQDIHLWERIICRQ